VLLVVLAIASVPFGLFADRVSRKFIIALGIVFWSIATFAGGLAIGFAFLLATRALVGLGEAAYAPAAQSMISGSFPNERRAMAQAVFASGMLLGGACGQVVGGLIGPRYGWQQALFVVAFAGLLPAVALSGTEEPPRGPRSEVVPVQRLLAVPAFLAMLAAGTCITFASVSLLTWGIDFAVSYKDFSVREAAVSLAGIFLISAVLGVLTGGAIADRLQRRYTYGRLIAIGFALLLATPSVLLALLSDDKHVVLAGLFVAGFFMSWYHGPVTAVIHDLMPRRAHATSIGIYMFVTQLLGGLGPKIVGKISDQHDLRRSVDAAGDSLCETRRFAASGAGKLPCRAGLGGLVAALPVGYCLMPTAAMRRVTSVSETS